MILKTNLTYIIFILNQMISGHSVCHISNSFLPAVGSLGPAQMWWPFWSRAQTSWILGRCSNQRRCLGGGTWWSWTLWPTTWWTRYDDPPTTTGWNTTYYHLHSDVLKKSHFTPHSSSMRVWRGVSFDVLSLIYDLPQSLPCCMQCHVILDHVIIAPDKQTVCIWKSHGQRLLKC